MLGATTDSSTEAGTSITVVPGVGTQARYTKRQERGHRLELDRRLAEICDYHNLKPMWKAENSAKGRRYRSRVSPARKKKRKRTQTQFKRLVWTTVSTSLGLLED